MRFETQKKKNSLNAIWSTLWLKLAIGNEFGHVEGLNHVLSDVLMYGSYLMDAYYRNPNLQYGPQADDIAGANALY